ncbi:MAG: TAT-variant-translocated molybdopterin oxidoreductase [Planctomycetota bacterium]
MTDTEVRTGAAHGGNEKVYWRSYDQLANTPEFQEIMHREFPEGIADHSGLTDEWSRRRFLGVVAASVALAGMTSCRKPAREILEFNHRPEGMVPGIPRYYATTLSRDGFGYGVLVRSNDGRPTKIEGNPNHPSTLGGTDSYLQAEILNLYDPARSKHIRQRGFVAAAEGEHAGGVPHGEPTHEGVGHAAVAADHPTFEQFRAFWSSHAAEIGGKRGAGFRVLMGPTASPTMHRLVETMRKALPQMRFHMWGATRNESVLEAARLATGKSLVPHYDFAQADVVASFDSDFLAADAPSLAWTNSWARSRKIRDRQGKVSRLWVAEATHTLTGSNADHRVRMSSAEVTAALLALAGKLNPGSGALQTALAKFTGPAFEGGAKNWISQLADDLRAAKGRAMVIVGPRQPALVQAVAHAINQELGSIGAGKPVSFLPAALGMERGEAFGDMLELAAAMKAGSVDTLVCIGTNPVYDAPADFGFADALAKVKHTVHCGMWVDETAQKCEWHIPLVHELEQWGDAIAADGRVSIVQPLIAPLHADCRSPIELLTVLMDEPRDGYEVVRDTWREKVPAAGFEAWWKRTVHDGVAAPDGAAAVVDNIDLIKVRDGLQAFAVPAAPTKDSIEVSFRPCPKLWDGRYSNNAWQQELPSPIERMVWDNAVLTSRATAAALGAKNGDLVKITLDGRSVEGPIWIQPGHADHCVTLNFGYGRRMDAACEVAADKGFDVFPLRASTALWTASGARIERTGRFHTLVVTQEHGTMEHRALVRENTLQAFKSSDWKAVDESPLGQAAKLEHEEESSRLVSLWQERDYSQGYRWGMVIDLNSCTGCGACVTACVAENNIPMVGKEQVATNREMFWNRIDRYFEGVDTKVGMLTIQEPTDDPKVVFQMVPCMQCENAPCESVCPVAATTHTPEGLNDMVYNRCIGTRYCSNNCPYKVRRFNWFNFNKHNAPERKLQFNPDVTVRARGVMEKCTYCVQRINAGKFAAKAEGRKLADGKDIRTACQQVCPAEAIVFGDLNDKESMVSKQAESPLNYAMLSELNVKPRTTYLAKIRNPKTEMS